MRRVNKRKLFLVMGALAVTLAMVSYGLKKAFDVEQNSLLSLLASAVVIGGGFLTGMGLLNKLVRDGRFKWLEE